MDFAFLVHPISEETRQLLEFDPSGRLKRSHGQDLLSFCGQLHHSLVEAIQAGGPRAPQQVRVVDELTGLVSARGDRVEGRLYEIPMDATAILADPGRAMQYMEEALTLATDWGAQMIGLGSMTGIVGGQGAYLAEKASIPVTTGNSLTVYSALEDLYHVCREVEVDLGEETVAIVGIPGSISTAAARMLAPRCKRLLLVARRRSRRATALAEELDAELLLDIPEALQRARVVLSATSSGSCIEQRFLQSGSIVVDVAVPTDVQGTETQREDVLILTGGLAQAPESMSVESHYLWLHRRIVPSCLAETMVLALENRKECFSLGRNLKPQRIEEIGELARSHGFSFSQLFSFGLPFDESVLVRFRKAAARRWAASSNGRPRSPFWSVEPGGASPGAEQLAPRAASLYARHVNPVLMAFGADSGFVKTFVKGQGTGLWDAEGSRYLDFVAGYGSMNLGHNHPQVVEAVSEALRQSAPGFAQSAVNPFAAALAEQLVTITPPGLEMVFFANSGTEAVEAALKLARRATGRSGLLYCHRSFHGKTFGSLSITGNPDYQAPFGPLLSECRAVPYGDLEALEHALAGRHFAALVVEPIQAEGGMIVPPDDYLREAQRLCRRTGTLLMVDEVQTGLGRTGTMFAVDRLDVEPDVMMLAKSLSGGLVPIGVMLARRDLWMKAYGTVHTFALHTSTFGGGSLACAAGLATLEVLRDENLPANAAARGRQLFDGLSKLCRDTDVAREVRGRGLLLGLELEPMPASLRTHWKQLDDDRLSSYLVPNLDEMIQTIPALYVMNTLLHEHRIYTQTTRSNPLVLRVQPPLTISAAEVSHFLNSVGACCREIEFSNKMIDGILAKSGLGQHEANQQGKQDGDASRSGTVDKVT